MSSAFAPMLDAMTRQRGVRASLVVDAEEGMTIDANLQIGQEGNRVAALAASLYRKARKTALTGGLGGTGFLQLESEDGRLCVIGGKDVVLVVLADRDANVGLIRVEMMRAAKVLG
ncbi:MAG: roadblock/LC7 domain-containing protein [Gemmatimonadaceae bacterium]